MARTMMLIAAAGATASLVCLQRHSVIGFQPSCCRYHRVAEAAGRESSVLDPCARRLLGRARPSQSGKTGTCYSLRSNPNTNSEGSKVEDYDDMEEGDPSSFPFIIRGGPGDELDDSDWDAIKSGQPSRWSVAKELMGINVFTYLLAGLIVILLSLNVLLGPGWLGSAIGIEGTGSFTEVSDSLPDTVDLSNPDFLL